ncbi:hypothetical protein JHK82_047871 [Glycine max]|nr:hypothetical protein JHK82_047871 [Glycine max]
MVENHLFLKNRLIMSLLNFPKSLMIVLGTRMPFHLPFTLHPSPCRDLHTSHSRPSPCPDLHKLVVDISQPMSPSMSLKHDPNPFGELLLMQKLEEVGSSVKVGIMNFMVGKES